MDKLFHIFYIGLRNGIGKAERASFLFAIFQSLLFSSIYFLGSSMISRKVIINTPLLYALLPSGIAVGLIFINSRYFVKTGRYRKILDKYGSESRTSRSRKVVSLIVSLFLVIISFCTFVLSGISLSRHLFN